MEKPDIHLINQMIKVNITSNMTYCNHIPLDMLHWEEHNTTSIGFLTKMQNLHVIKKKYQTNSHWSDIAQNKWPVIIKSIKFMKHKERLRNYSRFEESKEIQLLNALWDSGLDHGPKKGNLWDIWDKANKIRIKFVVNRIVLLLVFKFR